MSNILVLVDQSEGRVSKAGLATLQAAGTLKQAWSKSTINALCIGPGAKDAAESLGGCDVAAAAYVDSEDFKEFRAQAFSAAVLQAMEHFSADTFLTAANSNGRDFTPRVAAAIDAGQASEVLSVNADGSLVRPMYAGNAIATVEILTDKKVLTIRPTAFEECAISGTLSTVSELTVSVDAGLAGEVLKVERPESARPELTDASAVVSGGRALQSAENFEKYIFPLADALGGAVGASRAAVDSGYAPNDWQVGQTGKVVAPNLYIAVGISGAIQHIAGMKDSKVIVAINKDPDAPIFEVADYGLVADLYEVVEPLTAAIKEAKE